MTSFVLSTCCGARLVRGDWPLGAPGPIRHPVPLCDACGLEDKGAAFLHGCGGTWEPCPGWSARYRCSGCGTLGMKERLTSGGARGHEAIRPYLCAKRVKGKPCGRAATRRERRVCYCAEHAP